MSSDDYVVDGHHRWAAAIGADSTKNPDLDVARVDADILTLLKLSNSFAADWGIPQAAVN